MMKYPRLHLVVTVTKPKSALSDELRGLIEARMEHTLQAIEDTLHGLGVDETWRHDSLLQRAQKTIAEFLDTGKCEKLELMKVEW